MGGERYHKWYMLKGLKIGQQDHTHCCISSEGSPDMQGKLRSRARDTDGIVLSVMFIVLR